MFDRIQILPNMFKQHKTRWPNEKMFCHLTMFSIFYGKTFTVSLDRA